MKTQSPPSSLNILILSVSGSISLLCLWVASHSSTIWTMVGWAVAFSFVNNTLFSLVHEAVHRLFSKNRTINEFCGQLAAGFFPTSLTFQRTCHLGHHLRNRTDHEIFDMYYPHDNRLLKRLQFYSILLGPYWCSIPFGALVYSIYPKSFSIFKRIDGISKSTDAAMLIPFIDHPKELRIRAEVLWSLVFQVSLFVLLDLSWKPYLLCYWLFALNWSSLQYADHFWSQRDIRNGAWNLKVNKLTQIIFLNYHLHLAHHQNPNTPWLYLDRHVDHEEPKPSFIKIYLEMWRGPRPVDSPSPAFLDQEIKRLIEAQDSHAP